MLAPHHTANLPSPAQGCSFPPITSITTSSYIQPLSTYTSLSQDPIFFLFIYFFFSRVFCMRGPFMFLFFFFSPCAAFFVFQPFSVIFFVYISFFVVRSLVDAFLSFLYFCVLFPLCIGCTFLVSVSYTNDFDIFFNFPTSTGVPFPTTCLPLLNRFLLITSVYPQPIVHFFFYYQVKI